MIHTGSAVNFIKPNCEEFLEPNLTHHVWAVNSSPITTYGQWSLTLQFGLPNTVATPGFEVFFSCETEGMVNGF